MPARQPAAAVANATPDKGGAHSKTAGAALRSERNVSTDLHRWATLAAGPESRVEWILHRQMGGRHARRPDGRIPRRPVDRYEREPDERRRQADRTDPPAELWNARTRNYDR